MRQTTHETRTRLRLRRVRLMDYMIMVPNGKGGLEVALHHRYDNKTVPRYEANQLAFERETTTYLYVKEFGEWRLISRYTH